MKESLYLSVVKFNCPNVDVAKDQYCSSYIVEIRVQVFGNMTER